MFPPELKDLLKDLKFQKEIEEWDRIKRQLNLQRKLERDKKKYEHNMKLINGEKFEIVQVYKEKNPLGQLNDYAVVSDYPTAITLFEKYRSIGFLLKLHSLALYVDDEKWMKVNFKYKS